MQDAVRKVRDEEDVGTKPLRQPREGRQPKPIRQAESEIPVFALFASLAKMDPRTMSGLNAKKIIQGGIVNPYR